jgi:ATP-dependent HslUV protease ATP-binding subunit HslU
LLERLLEKVSFAATDLSEAVVVDAEYVNEHLGKIAQDEDLSQFIL